MKRTATIKLMEHQIPAPVEAVLDNVLELSIAKLEISSPKMIRVKISIRFANMRVVK
jgi:hypothetical protein